MKKNILLLIFTAIAALSVAAQDIVYADADKADVQRMNFEILGKLANKYLVYKETKGKNRISVYDENMRWLQDVPLRDLPARKEMLDLAFFTSKSHANLVYQYQQGNIVYLMGAKIESNGQMPEAAQVLDTTMLSYRSEGKIYNTLSSEDGNRIMLFKIRRQPDRTRYFFTTRLYDNLLSVVANNEFSLPMEETGYRLGSYQLGNDGTLAFIKYNRLNSGNITDAVLVEKTPNELPLRSFEIGSAGLFLDDIKLKTDEAAHRYLITSLFSNSKKGDIDGLYVSAIDKKNGSRLFETASVFEESLRKRAKAGTSLKTVFNDYFINNIVTHGSGTFAVASEALYSSGGNNWNRWGYWGAPLYSPWYYGGWGYWSPYRFYSPYFYNSYWWGSWAPWGRYYGGDRQRYHADNLIIITFDAEGNKTGDNVIVKKQSSAQTDGSISYQIVQMGNNIHFLMNNDGKISSLENIIISEQGGMMESMPVNAKDKYTGFMPRYGRQTGPDELILPFTYKKSIGFAKVKF